LSESSSNDASVHVEFSVDKGGLLLSSLVLQLRVQRLDLLLLLGNQIVALIHLQLSLVLLLLENEVILLDFVENFLSLLLPFEIKLLEIINFFEFVHFLQFVFLDLFRENLEVDAALSQFLIVLTIILLVSVVETLKFLVEFSTFNLIISNLLIGESQFILIAH
jgi:hypothetical protein